MAAVVCLGVVVGTVPVAAAPSELRQDSFEINMSPSTVRPGGVVTYSGTCFSSVVGPAIEVNIRGARRVDEPGDTPFDFTVHDGVDDDGSFSGRMVVPTDAPQDNYRLGAQCLIEDQALGGGNAPFEVAGEPSPWPSVVVRTHQDMVGRHPSVAEFTDWVAALDDGSATQADLVVALRLSVDNVSKVDPMVRLYRAFLGRSPDPGGLRFWITRRRAGTWTLTRVASHFAGSSEFKATYGPLSNRQYVTRLYTDVLRRAADAGGVDYWTRQLDLRRRDRGSVMVGFSESNEYRTKQREATDAAVVYLFLLGRSPTPEQLDTWVTRQRSGTELEELVTEILPVSRH